MQFKEKHLYEASTVNIPIVMYVRCSLFPITGTAKQKMNTRELLYSVDVHKQKPHNEHSDLKVTNILKCNTI